MKHIFIVIFEKADKVTLSGKLIPNFYDTDPAFNLANPGWTLKR